MSKKECAAFSARGMVDVRALDPALGVEYPLYAGRNVLTYRAADVMAAMVGGSASSAPSYIGFVYAADSEHFDNPETTRKHEWDDIVSLLEGKPTANMMICPVLRAASYGVTGNSDNYYANTVTLNAITDDSSPLLFPLRPRPGSSDMYFQIVVISEITPPGATAAQRVPYARARLGETGIPVATLLNMRLSAYWTSTYN